MPLTTTFDEFLRDRPTGDSELDEMLQEARRITGVDWQVKRIVRHSRRRWRPWRKQETAHYQLLSPAPGFPPWQVIIMGTFPEGVWSRADRVIAYLWGAIGQAEATSWPDGSPARDG